jgi:ankyrin repeat protein
MTSVRRSVWPALALVFVCAAVPFERLAARASLIEAIKAADAAEIRRLVKAGTDVNAHEVDGTTALHWAVRMGEPATVELLLRAGANANAVNRYHIAPLSVASTSGQAGIVRLLLDAGADVKMAAPGGETALMSAARAGSLEAVELLASRGADLNAKEAGRGQTALMWAAEEGHASIVKALLARGADVNTRSSGGFTALLFAVRAGRLEVVNALLAAGANPNESLTTPGRRGGGAAGGAGDNGGLTAFLIATANAHYELALALAAAGADVNAAPQGWTVLHQITGVRKVGLYGSNDPAPEGSGAVDSLEFVRAIVKRGADVNARVRRRINLGITSLNTIGATPFLLAARTADVPLMRLLVELGADPKIPNADNSTPLHVAAGVGTSSPPEDPGTEPEVVEAVRLALDLGNEVNAVDNQGETAMHGAAYKQVPAAVRLLVARGADVKIWNQKNSRGWTPLKITQGVHRGMNIQQSATTEAAVKEAMIAAGVEPVVPPGSSIEPANGRL